MSVFLTISPATCAPEGGSVRIKVRTSGNASDESQVSYYLTNTDGTTSRADSYYEEGTTGPLSHTFLVTGLPDGDDYQVIAYNQLGQQAAQSLAISCGTGTTPVDPPPPPTPLPTLTLLTEDSGYVGDSIFLTGTYFTGASKVTFSGKSALFTFLSDTQLQATVPAGSTSGDVQVVVGSQLTNTLPFTLLEAYIPPVVEEPQPEIPGWTISWQLDFQSWTGEHTQVPTFYLSRNQDTYRLLEKSLVKQTTDRYGLPLFFRLVANESPLKQKSFDTILLDYQVTNSSLSQPQQRYTTFSTLSFQTTYQHSGVLVPFIPTSYQDKWNRVFDPTQLALSPEKDHYQGEIPGDVVVDQTLAPTDPANWNTQAQFKPRLSGKWTMIELTFQGSPFQKMLLQTARVLSRFIPR